MLILNLHFAHCISQGNIMQSVIKKFVILILAAAVISENVSDGKEDFRYLNFKYLNPHILLLVFTILWGNF